MPKENRKYKDSVFVDLFYSDETAAKNLLSLYNALHGASLTDESLIKKVKIKDILYKNFNNDISCQVNNEVFIFGECQSAVNPNIPLRYAMYAGRAYEQILDKWDRYRTRLVKIPTPEFYVFYNGKQDYPAQRELSLLDAFMARPGGNSMELKVTVININTNKAHRLLADCRVLREYSQFVETVRAYRNEEDAIKKAIEECIGKGILAEYLIRKGSKVRNMLVAEYSYEEDLAVKQEEARQEGISQGAKQERTRIALRVLASAKSIKKTAHILDLDEQTVADIAAANSAIDIDDRETD